MRGKVDLKTSARPVSFHQWSIPIKLPNFLPRSRWNKKLIYNFKVHVEITYYMCLLWKLTIINPWLFYHITYFLWFEGCLMICQVSGSSKGGKVVNPPPSNKSVILFRGFLWTGDTLRDKQLPICLILQEKVFEIHKFIAGACLPPEPPNVTVKCSSVKFYPTPVSGKLDSPLAPRCMLICVYAAQ